MSDDTDEIIEEIRMSRCYSLVLARTSIGRAPAVSLKLRHISPETGESRWKGGVDIFLNTRGEVLEALERVKVQREQAEMWGRQRGAAGRRP
ncbi:MAG: hypothetical protein ACHQWU_12255 [Gemmatimonadales bacterium]